MRAFILAGGFATRLWPLTEHRPKPLLPLAGKALLTHLIAKLPQDLPVTVSTNAAFQHAFNQWMDSMADSVSREFELVIEDTRADDHKLGALGAIAQWIRQEKIDDDLLILTGDNYLGFSMPDFLGSFNGNALIAAHDIGDPARASAFGVVTLDPGGAKRVTKFEEKPKTTDSTLISTGCVILPRSVLPILIEFAALKPDNLGGIFEELLRRRVPIDCFTFTEPWMDIGSFQSYLEAHRALVGERLILENGAAFDGSTAKGGVVVGAGSKVTNSELDDTMVFDRCVIEDCTLRHCVIDNECTVRGVDLQNQMLRTGTKLEVDW